MKLTTTLNLLRKHNACVTGLKILIDNVGKDYAEDKPINLLTILESNCVGHFFWATRAIEQNFIDVKSTLISILCDIAESVLYIFESKHPGNSRPRDAIEAARKVAADDTEENRNAAKSAAYSSATAYRAASYAPAAAYIAADYASASPDADADDASADAVEAAKSAAYADYRAGAYANYDVNEREKQKEIIKKYLSWED